MIGLRIIWIRKGKDELRILGIGLWRMDRKSGFWKGFTGFGFCFEEFMLGSIRIMDDEYSQDEYEGLLRIIDHHCWRSHKNCARTKY